MTTTVRSGAVTPTNNTDSITSEAMAFGFSSPILPTQTAERFFYDFQGIRTRSEDGAAPNLCPKEPGQLASAVFKVSAANVITSMQIEGGGERSEPDDVFRLLVSRNAGIGWTSVWESPDTGTQKIRLRLRDEVAGVTECLVKVEMQAAKRSTNVGLEHAETDHGNAT